MAGRPAGNPTGRAGDTPTRTPRPRPVGSAVTAQVAPGDSPAWRVLVVDDDPSHRMQMIRALSPHGFEIEQAVDGRGAVEAVRNGRFDLVLLDVNMPGDLDGYNACTEIKRTSDVLVVFLTAMDTEDNELLGRDLGADDYIPKGTGAKLILARVQSVLRRAQGRPAPATASSELTFDDGRLRIDEAGHKVWVEGELVTMPAKEFELLVYFAKRPRQVLATQHLLHTLWDELTGRGSLTEHVRRVREKIKDDKNNPRFIHTVRGVGYRFED